MAKTKSVLGRGLASLIPRQPSGVPLAPGVPADDGAATEVIVRVPLEKVERNPFQPRADFDPAALEELKLSILEKGVIQPITVRRISGGYQLISGERRVRAAREAGLEQVPAYVISVRSEEEMLELALIENLQREHLNPMEIAISYRRLIEECSLTQEEVSQRIGKDRTTITNFLRLLRLPQEIQHALRTGGITTGHARALVSLEDEKRQMEIFRRALSKGLSVREVERLVRTKGKKRPASAPGERLAVTSAVAHLEDRLQRVLGTKVRVRPITGGKGEILIEYYSASDLERLIDMIADLEGRPSGQR
jgi:ParB family chromosome partitioning protein